MLAYSTKAHLKKTHIIPLEMDGTDDSDNIVNLCDQCHTFIERRRLKDSDNPDLFLEKIDRDILDDPRHGQSCCNWRPSGMPYSQ